MSFALELQPRKSLAQSTCIEAWAMRTAPDSRLHITIDLESLPTKGDPSALMTGLSSKRAKACRSSAGRDRAIVADFFVRLVAHGAADAGLLELALGAHALVTEQVSVLQT